MIYKSFFEKNGVTVHLTAVGDRHGQFDPKATAFTWLGLDSGVAAHSFDAFADNRQADPSTGKLVGTDQPHERLE